MTASLASKPILRAQARAALSALLPDARAAYSLAIVHHLSTLGVDTREGPILAFAPMPSEPDIAPLIRRRLAAGLPTAIPCVDWQTSAMVPRLIKNWDRDVVSAGRGVCHAREACPALDVALMELVLVPGLAFDHAGNRLGRGGGHYDRFLARLAAHTLTMGVAFDVQIVDNPPLPSEGHDRPVHIVVTESRTIFGAYGKSPGAGPGKDS